MTSVTVAPELKQVLGAMLFGSRQPASATDLRRVMQEVAEVHGEEGRQFSKVTEKDVLAALEQLKTLLAENRMGLHLVEVAGGFRLQTDPECGPWLRHLLEMDKPSRLSRPTLETLAIIAYRQPVTRAEIEAVRGVTVDTIVRHLLELQLIRIMGRSPLPGRPLLYGTTQLFLEHFGLKSVKELPGIEQLCRREEEYERRQRAPAATAEGKTPGEMPADQTPETKNIAAESPAMAGGEAPDPDKAKDEDKAEKNDAPNEPEAEDDDEDDEEDEDNEEEDEEAAGTASGPAPANPEIKPNPSPLNP